MASTWNLFKKIGQKKVDDFRQSSGKSFSDKIDRDLPLGLRFNCLVEFPEVDFILAGDDLLIKYPGASCSVVSYGKFPVGDSMLHRFYLDTSEGPYMLQIVADNKKIIEECKLFMPYDEIYPDDWGFWLAEQDGYIGLSIFDTKSSVRFLGFGRTRKLPELSKVMTPERRSTEFRPCILWKQFFLIHTVKKRKWLLTRPCYTVVISMKA